MRIGGELPPLPPMADVHSAQSWAIKFTLGCLAATWLLMRLMRRQSGTPTLLPVLLVPLCLVPIAFTNLTNDICFAPDFRLNRSVFFR